MQVCPVDWRRRRKRVPRNLRYSFSSQVDSAEFIRTWCSGSSLWPARL